MRFTKKSIEDLSTSRRQEYFWEDSDDIRFGVCVYRSGRKVYVLDYRTEDGRRRRMNISPVAALVPTDARALARQLAAEIAKGRDPIAEKQAAAAKTITVGELWDRYLEEHLEHPRPEYRKGHRPYSKRTVDEYKAQWRKYLKPVFGKMRVEAVTHADVRRLHRRVGRKYPTRANRLVASLSAMFSFGERVEVLPRGTNPARGIILFEEKPRKRRLYPDELERLGEVLRIAETGGGTRQGLDGKSIEVKGEWWQGIACIRLALLTGCRKNEIQKARWSWFDLERGILNLPNSKGGSRPVPLNAAALAVLADLPRLEGSPGRDPRRPFDGVPHVLERIRDAAEIKPEWNEEAERWENACLHSLRHTVGSESIDSGTPVAFVQSILGHKDSRTTQRYAHVGRGPVHDAAERVGQRLADAMAAKDEDVQTETAEVIEHPNARS